MQRHDNLSQWSKRNLSSTSVIRRIFLMGQSLREKNPDVQVIDLSLGNPDLEPPPEVAKALINLAHDTSPGVHRYMDNAGWDWVRGAVARELQEEHKLPIGASSVYMTCGAAGALHILMRALLDPGDEVLLLAPYFVEYTTYLSMHGATPVVVPLRSDIVPGAHSNCFVPTIDAIRSRLTPKTRMILTNSPNNPSGCVYPLEFWQELDRTLAEHQATTGRSVHVVSDEPYAHLTFEGIELPSVLGLVRNAWLVRSHSKDLGLAGERIGYIAWPSAPDDDTVLNALRAAARALGFVNAPALMQRLLPLVLRARVNTGIYEDRARIFCGILGEGGLAVERPSGTFFVLPQTPPGFSDEAFCEAAAQQGVLVVPAGAFGAPGFFRVSLTQRIELIEQAAKTLVSIAKSSPKPA
jgi:aspartate aminotransferase